MLEKPELSFTLMSNEIIKIMPYSSLKNFKCLMDIMI